MKLNFYSTKDYESQGRAIRDDEFQQRFLGWGVERMESGFTNYGQRRLILNLQLSIFNR